VQVVLDDDEVSSDEDEPLHMRLQSSSTIGGSSGPTSARADKKAAEEAATKEAAY
jgi:hypothetical protein